MASMILPTLIEEQDAPANHSTSYEITVGESAQGDISFLGDHDRYKVFLESGKTYAFALIGTGTSSLEDPFLKLISTDDSLEKSDDDSGPALSAYFYFRCRSSGYYYLDASAVSDNDLGRYGISVTENKIPSFDLYMGAGALNSYASWSNGDEPTIVTYAFRTSEGDYGPASFSKLSIAQIKSVESILDLWSDVCNIKFQRINPTGFSDNATILFGNYRDPYDGAGAYAYYPGSILSTDPDGDVWLNLESVTTGSIDIGTYSYFAIMHELGHAIGLSHPGDYNAGSGTSITYQKSAQFIEDSEQYSVMSYFAGSNTGESPGDFATANTPLLFDIEAIQSIYGVNLTTRINDSIYGFNCNVGDSYSFASNPILSFCIWDAGGNDTIDCSQFSSAQLINLNAGTFSSTGGQTNNLSIAFGAEIENAIGGSGNDILIAGDKEGSLRGGLGADQFIIDAGNYSVLDFGMGGNDSIEILKGATVNLTINQPSLLASNIINHGILNIISNGFSVSAEAIISDGTINIIGTGASMNLDGTSGNDTLTGGSNDDVINGLAGNDLIYGGAGGDRLLVGAMSIMLYDGTIKYNNYATVEPASGNITAGNISTTGNIVANNIGNIAALNLTGNASTVLYGNGVFAAAAASSSYGNANVAANLAAFASNPITTTGNITAGNIIGNINPTSNINGTTANVTLVAGAYNWNFDNTGNLTLPANTFSVNYANGTTVALGGNYGNANVVANLAALGSNPISTTGNVTAGNIIVSGTANTGVYALDVGAPAAFLSNTVSSFTANVNNYTQVTLQNLNTGADATADFILTANNGNDTVNYSDFGIINSGYDNATPTNSLGNIVFAADTYLYAQGNTSNASQSGGNLAIGTTTAGKNVKIFAGGVTNSSIVANIANTGVAVTGTVSATGNISTSGSFVGNGIGLTNVTVSAAGNIVGTSSNVSLVAGSYTTTFDNTGNLTLPGNTFSVNYANNTPVNAVTRFESLWTVPVGTSTQSFTVAASETYYLWVDCNIPNGILVWNATATVTNTNVPVVGAQYAWVYTGGGTPIDFTSIPNQFVGTSNTIVRSSVAPSATTNRFDFGLNNTSGGNVTVRYGWIAIS